MGTVEVVFATHGKGTRWLADRRRGDKFDVIGRPLGRPSPCQGAGVLRAGRGRVRRRSLFMLSEQLRSRGCRVDMVLGAATEDRLFGVWRQACSSASVTVTTDDGSAGDRRRVTDPLAEIIRASGADVVYACGPMAMLALRRGGCRRPGAHSQCLAVEVAWRAGIGVCMTCVLPVRGSDGVTNGPLLHRWAGVPGSDVRWSDVGTVPADTLGAPVAGGH